MSTSKNAYVVERIIDEEIVEGKAYYLIKWQGYSSMESTWEPIENLIHALDILHSWKVQRNCHSIKETETLAGLKKTKKIGEKEHQIREKELQSLLNSKARPKRKNIEITIEDDENALRIDSSQELDKEHDTCELENNLEVIVEKKSRPKTYKKPTKPSAFEDEEYELPRHSTRNQGSVKSSKITSHNGYSVIGKITKEQIKTVLWCFEWESQNVCEIQLKDGRKVNMKRDDVKRLCPDKLLKYYERLSNSKI